MLSYYDIGYSLFSLLFPVFGLLADIKRGRYKTVITGVYFAFVSWIIASFLRHTLILIHLCDASVMSHKRYQR